MAAKKGSTAAKKIKNLRAKSLTGKQAKDIKGGSGQATGKRTHKPFRFQATYD